MKVLFNKKFLEHNIISESEGAYRIEDFKDLESVDADGEAYITLVHTEKYKNWIREACRYEDVVAEVKLSPASYEAACLAVGLTVMASEQDGFAAVRPPGHHAGREKAAGFCFFNNISIAVQKLVNEGKRVFIMDIDGHHGDGTQAIFYDSDQVLFASIHQEYAYPFTGFKDETGEGNGKGYTLNFPLMAGSGDKDFLAAVDKSINSARQFKPDVVAVSAGFDGYQDDRLLGLNYTSEGFYECALKLRRAFPHIFAVLEGGYHFDNRKLVDGFVEGINKGALPPTLNWDDNMAIG